MAERELPGLGGGGRSREPGGPSWPGLGTPWLRAGIGDGRSRPRRRRSNRLAGGDRGRPPEEAASHSGWQLLEPPRPRGLSSVQEGESRDAASTPAAPTSCVDVNYQRCPPGNGVRTREAGVATARLLLARMGTRLPAETTGGRHCGCTRAAPRRTSALRWLPREARGRSLGAPGHRGGIHGSPKAGLQAHSPWPEVSGHRSGPGPCPHPDLARTGQAAAEMGGTWVCQGDGESELPGHVLGTQSAWLSRARAGKASQTLGKPRGGYGEGRLAASLIETAPGASWLPTAV